MDENIQEIINMYNFVLAGSFAWNGDEVFLKHEDNNLLSTKKDIVYLWVADNTIAYVGQSKNYFTSRNHHTSFNLQKSGKYITGLEILKKNEYHLDIYIREPNKQTVLNVHDVSLRHAEEMSIYKYLKGINEDYLLCNKESL